MAIAGTSAALLVTGLAITAAPAQAATNPYTATQVCGSSYSEIDRFDTTYVDVILMWNGTNNCAVALKRGSAAGTSTRTGVFLEAQRGGYDEDEGSFTWYAGPVYVYGVGRCVIWGGYTKNPGIYGNEDKSWSHCS
jgi:hypothetical protein